MLGGSAALRAALVGQAAAGAASAKAKPSSPPKGKSPASQLPKDGAERASPSQSGSIAAAKRSPPTASKATASESTRSRTSPRLTRPVPDGSAVAAKSGQKASSLSGISLPTPGRTSPRPVVRRPDATGDGSTSLASAGVRFGDDADSKSIGETPKTRGAFTPLTRSATSHRTGGFNPAYFLEKEAVVIDFGSAFTKIGFAAESKPRHILATPELRPRPQKAGGPLSRVEWIDVLDRLLTKLFFHYLGVSPKDRRVVICEEPFAPAAFRIALAHLLFKRFNVPSIKFILGLVLPLYLTGLSSGIVVDCGYDCARVLPVFAGVPLLSALGEAASGGRHINEQMRKRLMDELQSPPSWLDDEDVVEDLKAQVCYVKCNLHVGKEGRITLGTDQVADFTPAPGCGAGRASAASDTAGSIAVPNSCRWQPCEALFGPAPQDEAHERSGHDGGVGDAHLVGSIQEALARALERCPVDVSAAVVQNVVVVGGLATLRGLLPRLAVEIRDELLRRPRTAALAERLRICPLDFPPVCAAWAGGSIYGALGNAGEYTAEDYSRGRPLPDWTQDGFV